MDQIQKQETKELQEALEIAAKIIGLLEETTNFDVDLEAKTLTFEGNTVHVSSSGIHRVTSGVGLVFSGTEVKDALIEAVTAAVAARTREYLRSSIDG